MLNKTGPDYHGKNGRSVSKFFFFCVMIYIDSPAA
jgi:hypothetical protein